MIDAMLVGLGARGRYFVQGGAFGSPRYRLVLGVDTSEDSRRQTSELAPQLSLADDYQRALREIDCAAVILATPACLHHEQVAAALTAGKHVYVEKPFTYSHRQAIELTRLAQQQNRKLMVGQNLRYVPLVRWLRREVKTGDLGNIGYLSLTHNRHRPVARNLANIPHVWLRENAVHDWDQLLAVVQRRPIRVSACDFDTGWSDYRQGAAHSLVEFEGDLHVIVEGSFIGQSNDFRLRMECERGTVIADSYNTFNICQGQDIRRIEMDEDPSVGLGFVTEAFADYIEKDIEPECSAGNNLRTMQLICAAVKSAEQGRPIDIPEAADEAID